MEVDDRGSSGVTVTVNPGDKLTAVPKSHQHIVTKEIKAVFGDAPGYFGRIAEKASSPNMTKWLWALCRENLWTLELHRNEYGNERAGFGWRSQSVLGAEIGLPKADGTVGMPKPLAGVFKLVRFIDWSGWYEGGGLISYPSWIQSWRPMPPPTGEQACGIDWEHPGTLGWGGFNGDCLFATADDRAGWIGIGGNVALLGTVAEAVEWWFGQLLANKSPTMDYVYDTGSRGEVA